MDSSGAVAPPQPRSRRTASPNRDALLAAARDRFAATGPGGVSIRSVAEAAGCSHTLVGRHFGSKEGLEQAVVEWLADRMATHRERLTTGSDVVPVVTEALGDDPTVTRLLVRSALGELDPTPLVRAPNLATALAGAVERRRGGAPDQASASARVTAYLVLSTVLGHLTFAPFLRTGCRLRAVPAGVRAAAVTGAAEDLVALGADPATDLGWGPQPRPRALRPGGPGASAPADERLLAAAVRLYAERGPASVSTRDIAAAAGVHQGLIYHYFGSREDLMGRALERANRSVVEAAVGAGRFDRRGLIFAQPDLGSMVIVARHLVDGGDLTGLWTRYPVLDALLRRYPEVPTGPGPGTRSDPRLAVMTASGCFLATAVWDRFLRRALGIPASADLRPALYTATDRLLTPA